MSTTSAAGIWATSIILPLLDLSAISLRFYARSRQKSGILLDDWLQIPALILFLGIAIAGLFGVANHAFGYPTPMAAPPTRPPESLLLVEKLVQTPCQGITKLSALFFYKRIFVTHRGPSSYIIWSLAAITIVWILAFMSFYLSVCGNHLSTAWSGWLGFAECCIKSEHFEQAYAISDFLLDTLILLIPLPAIWRLHTTLGRKFGITCVFLLALIGYGASIARVAIFVELSEGALSHTLPDVQATDTQALWFTNLEIGLTILALNLPSIWGLVSHPMLSSKFLKSMRSLRSLHSLRSLRSIPSSSHLEVTNPLGDDAIMDHGANIHGISSKVQRSFTLNKAPKDQYIHSSINLKPLSHDKRDIEANSGEQHIMVSRTIDLTETHC